MKKKQVLTWKEFEAIFDVLNVYDPNDIMDVFPEMGKPEFLDDVRSAWNKILTELEKNDRHCKLAGGYHGASGSPGYNKRAREEGFNDS